MLGKALQAWGHKNTSENQHKTDPRQNKTHKTLQAGHTHTPKQPPTTLLSPPRSHLQPKKHQGKTKGAFLMSIFQEQPWKDLRKRLHHVPSSLVALLVPGDFVRQGPLPQIFQVPHHSSSLHQSLDGAFQHGSCLRLEKKKERKVRNS